MASLIWVLAAAAALAVTMASAPASATDCDGFLTPHTVNDHGATGATSNEENVSC